MRAPPAPRCFRFRCAVWACVLGFGFRLRPASPWGGVEVCVCSCARTAWSPAPPGWRCCARVRVCARFLLDPRLSWLGCGVWACVLGLCLGCAPPFLAGLSGCIFCAFFLGVSWFGFVVSVAGCPCPGPCCPCPPIPFLSGWAAGSFFFPACCVSACFGVAFFGGPLFLAWCCWFWLGGPPVPPWGSCLRCLLGGGFGRLLWCWRAVWWLCAVLSPPPPYPPFSFLFWGGACLFLPLPSPGWRTHWPAFSVVFRAAVGGCVLLGRVSAPWVGWAMYTLGSAPLPAGLAPGSAGWAAAPAAACGSGLGGWGCPCPFSSSPLRCRF